MATLTRIALVCTFRLAYCRRILRGVKRYAEDKPHWVLLPIDAEPAAVSAARHFRPDGAIAYVISRQIGRALTRQGVPVVNVCGVLGDLPFPRVGSDNVLIGRTAAAYYLDRGFEHFAYVGHHDHDYSVQREQGFREAVTAAGRTIIPYHVRAQPFDPMGRQWSLHRRVQDWVRGLPKPTAVFACNDQWGFQLSEACRQTGARVPEDVAILGVQDDDLLCELARPSLSSIAIPAERMGFEAAAMLDRLLTKTRSRPASLLLPPTGVVSRQSTDLVAHADADVAAAARFIRENAHRPIRVGDVLAAVPVSRRSLERRFRRTLHAGMGKHIRRAHLERAMGLLARTGLPISAVAERSGLTDAKQLDVMFRQEMKLTPTAYRKQFREG
jgi:LacI family transcriptional regulator